MNASDSACLTLAPVLPNPDRPSWSGAVWIGEVWLDAVESADRASAHSGTPAQCLLQNAEGFSRARLLVRDRQRAVGFVDIAVTDGQVAFTELRDQVGAQRQCAARPALASAARPSARSAHVTVVLCTRDRTALLKSAVASVLAAEHPDFDVLIIDNAPRSDATREFVTSLADSRVRLITEPVPGLSRARNTGLLAATGDIVAFVDDDVVVDRDWLSVLVKGFGYGDSVGCVSGMVPAGELRTPAQAYFENRAGWTESAEVRIFEWSQAPHDVPLYPFEVRYYGTGANFAVDRQVALSLGGFDERLGAGTRVSGGEDIDMFFRILRSGRQLVREPAAIAWHRHRATVDDLRAQTRGYGLGLGAWLAKLASDPAMAFLALKTVVRRRPALVRHLRSTARRAAPSITVRSDLPSDIGNGTWRFIAAGAWVYLVAAWRNRLRRASG
ncbi:glycosyl transferase family 2 [Mycolicibacterium aromaticivorans JS19b1 = JCM 16368]|uniref:Glycosyl transferase family 2 n=1 Tax=Mycolicibacterium aromaticivorans JS19b1 = JCM 16368 TaxID=1440774 RepID=A0A064CE60_9MYCO|nr:glycosyltransferase [Mycolicibacterium aromaticivorans]KDE98615.1 glycosyl transferase family 2 [Mycolicibacterium aromaticivorans JS19b1 = JCM 16368]